MWRFPEALGRTHLVSQLGIQEIRTVEPPPYRADIDSTTGIRNVSAIRDYSIALSQVIEQVLRSDQFPLVIGGDCSILLGSALALRRLGRYGLMFVDGHTDFLTPSTSSTGGAAGMDLALVTGHGPHQLTTLEGYTPMIEEKDVVAFGFRDMDDAETYPARLIFTTQVQHYALDRIRAQGFQAAVQACLEHFRQNEVAGIWLHLDVDALNDEIMPAVDSRQPGGLSYEEMVTLIRLLMQSGLLCGMQITIFDPELDPEGHLIHTLATHLIAALDDSGS
ncbi:MAG: arginase family protein [Anaerolineae bacterium]